ncbi:MAG: tRNA (adenosine(37)-N6)-threonylcarbamoyltransferase complex dimerization subunit type 1 TsaB [Planctomycetota bacterium]|nr:tRNA (adenosine(37)-N6)-threonylcarbamoyltransferase complex dimerization subunit type 1 TsaB [Planctomycetota bacterium]
MKIPSDGWILMIETSQRDGSVALGTLDGQQVDEELFSPGLVHGKELLPRIDTIVKRNAAREKLSAVAVSAGPGSFTGVRIGVSAAKAIAWALHIPALGISSLDIIASNIDTPGRWGVLLDASSGDLDVGFYQITREGAVREGEELASHRDQLAILDQQETRFIGAGSRNAEMNFKRETGPLEWDLPTARKGLEVAISRVHEILEGENSPPGWESPHMLNPRYMRVSRAEEVRRRRLAGEEQA